MTDMCPHCGYNFEADKPLEIDGYVVTQRYCLLPDGSNAGLTLGEAAVLYTIAKGNGERVSGEAVRNRVSDSEDSNTVAVLVYRARRKFGPLWPIESLRGRVGGYRWRAP